MLSVSQKKYQAADLFRNDPFYSDNSPSWIARNVFLPIEYGKSISFIRDNKLRGLVTYAFLTEKELKENRIDAVKVFQRNEGGQLHFCQFLCRSGRQDVLDFVRHITKTLSKKYPEAKTATAIRKHANGSQRPSIWFRKDAL
tara:strand:+ start:5146 stop:5571 length:426 start_codon:yes stop_codon:yes gene_type:complete